MQIFILVKEKGWDNYHLEKLRLKIDPLCYLNLLFYWASSDVTLVGQEEMPPY